MHECNIINSTMNVEFIETATMNCDSDCKASKEEMGQEYEDNCATKACVRS